MLTFRSFLVLFSTCCLLAATPSAGHAFDPEKVFKNNNPSIADLFRYFFSAREKGDQEEAVSALEYAAEHGNQAAQWKLGRMYQIGDGVNKDPAAAYQFFRQIVDKYSDALPGTPEWQFTSNAMVALGHYHRIGVPEGGIQRDPAKARVLFTTAATYFGNPEAQYELARMYLEEDGNDAVETIQAARMLKSAAKAGHVGAEALLGHLLFEGVHLRREPVRGLAMLMNARNRANAADAEWINRLQEEALALASESERAEAQSRLQKIAEVN